MSYGLMMKKQNRSVMETIKSVLAVKTIMPSISQLARELNRCHPASTFIAA
jgi:hypothetical protein